MGLLVFSKSWMLLSMISLKIVGSKSMGDIKHSEVFFFVFLV